MAGRKVWIDNTGARVVALNLKDGGQVVLGPGITKIDAEDAAEIKAMISGGPKDKGHNAAVAGLFDPKTPGHLMFKGEVKEGAPAPKSGSSAAPTGGDTISTPDGTQPAGGEPNPNPGATDNNSRGDQEDGDGDVDPDDSLSGMAVGEATEIVGSTYDRRELRSYRAAESAGKNRKGVLEAIDAQLSRIELSDAEKKTAKKK